MLFLRSQQNNRNSNNTFNSKLTNVLRALSLGLIVSFSSLTAAQNNELPLIFETNLGTFEAILYPDKAPKTVRAFLKLVDSGFYDGTIFHRVIPNFVAQGGGFKSGMKPKADTPTVANESDNGLSNELGTLAMARTNDPHSASSQFFINLNDNLFLDHKGKTPNGWGYAVFGRVTKGLDVINSMQKQKTGVQNFHRDVPIKDIIITKAYRKKQQPTPTK